jgi:hypothetical protein
MQGPKGQMSGVIPVGKETWGNRPLDSIGSPSGTCGNSFQQVKWEPLSVLGTDLLKLGTGSPILGTSG